MANSPLLLATIAAGTGGFVLNGIDATDLSGWSVASAGDIDGDGYDDLIIGARQADAAGNAKGSTGDTYVVFGGAALAAGHVALATIAAGTGGFVLYGRDSYDRSGYSVASAGDINGDGFADLIIGASAGAGAANATGNIGESYVVFGKASGWGAAIELETIAAGTGGFVVYGRDGGDRLGWSVASAGDVNGDGFADLIFGASAGDGPANGVSDSGESYVVFGKTTGWDAALDLAAIAAGTGGFVLYGRDSYDRSGYSVASAGDINGDGFADLIIGAAYSAGAANATINSGESYVVFGKAAGWGATINLATIAAGTGGFVAYGRDGGDRSGTSVASAGDINGDGFADLIIGARLGDGPTNTTSNAGEAYVVFGKASGWDAAISLATIAAGTGGFVVYGRDGNDQSGRSVASAGDVNGDGYDDLVIGAPQGDGATNTTADLGESYVVFGKASGWGSDIDLAAIAAGTGGYIIYGEDSGDNAGWPVATAGDVNGDGFADLLVGAKFADTLNNTFNNAGDTYLIYGSDLTGSVTHAGTSGDDSLTGTAGADVMVGGQGNDTLRGDGAADALAGGAGDDVLRVSDLTFLRVDGGSGTDTLALDGSGIALALAGIAGTRLRSIERIDLTGSGDNSLSLTMLEVLNLATTSNTLRVLGNAGDSVTLGGTAWSASTVEAGFATYTNGAASLLLADAVSVTMVFTGTGGADSLVGGSGNDTLNGGNGNDVLTGGLGADSLVGGIGDDIYYVDDAGDVVQEASGEGTDRVFTTIDLTLGANLERLILSGGGNLNGTGNALANQLDGNAGDNLLDGGDGDDRLAGAGGNDTLIGGIGNDKLVGGAGTDSLVGGTGDDLYVVEDATDVVVEAADEGIDSVQSTVSWVLGAAVEHLTLLGAAINGTGNALANSITGNDAGNQLSGLGGNDSLTGGAGADTLLGGEGADRLDGGTGADSLEGGAGDDLYLVDNDSDVVVELGGGGIDRVIATLSFTLAAQVENLTLGGAAAIDGTGNTLANAITGNGANNRLDGGDGNDSLVGGAGADTLLGGDGADQLDGGTGADSMEGGAGNDVYIVDDIGDVVVELAAGGIDKVTASVSFTLSAEVEQLSLGGAVAIDGTGNALANTLAGNGAANLLLGMVGNDTITGGAGSDVFRFDAANEGGDRIVGYAGAEDALAFSATGFGGGLAEGVSLVATTHFTTNTTGLANSAVGVGQFIWRSNTQTLLWDADGAGGDAAVLLATMTGATGINAGEFIIIA